MAYRSKCAKWGLVFRANYFNADKKCGFFVKNGKEKKNTKKIMYLIRRALLYETSEKSMSKNTRNHEYREPLLPAEATLRTKPIKKTNTTLGTVQIQIL